MTQKEPNDRQRAIENFEALHLGQLDTIEAMRTDDIKDMIKELIKEREANNLNLETNLGIRTLKEVITKYEHRTEYKNIIDKAKDTAPSPAPMLDAIIYAIETLEQMASKDPRWILSENDREDMRAVQTRLIEAIQ